MIDNVVVAVIDASSVRAGAQGALDGFGRGIGIEHVDGPVYPAGADAGAFPFQIIPDGVVGTVRAHRAVKTAQGSSFRRIFLAKQVVIAVGADEAGAFSGQPDEDVHIVTAFGKDHRAGLVAAPPVSAHIAVGMMPVADLLHRLDRYHIPDPSCVDHLLDRIVKGRVAQDVADDHMPLIGTRHFQHLQTALDVNGNGFFQKKMIPCL